MAFYLKIFSILGGNEVLGPRQAGEGAPADSTQQGQVLAKGQPATTANQSALTNRQRSSAAPQPPERKGSHLSHPCVAAAAMAADLPPVSAVSSVSGTARFTGRYVKLL